MYLNVLSQLSIRISIHFVTMTKRSNLISNSFEFLLCNSNLFTADEIEHEGVGSKKIT